MIERIWSFLNENNGGVIAVASLITAIATCLVALFTVATLRIYQIERDRDLSLRRQTGARITRLLLSLGRLHSRFAADVAQANRGAGSAARQSATEKHNELSRITEEARGIYDTAAAVAPDLSFGLQTTVTHLEEAVATLNQVTRDGTTSDISTIHASIGTAGGALWFAHELSGAGNDALRRSGEHIQAFKPAAVGVALLAPRRKRRRFASLVHAVRRRVRH